MIFLKLLLTGGLTFLTAMAIDKPLLLLNNIRPEHYDIKFKQYALSYGYNSYYGEWNVNVNILQATKRINFHMSNTQCIMDIELIDNPAKFRKYDNEMIIYKPIKHLRDNNRQIVELIFTNEMPSGRYILNMKFTDKIADNENLKTLYSMEGENIAWLAATHIKTSGVRQLFPCWDRPEFRATLYSTFNISVLHNRNYMVISNMPVYKYDAIGDFMWTHFLTTPAISAHLITAIVIHSQLFDVTSYTENISIFHRRKASTDLSYAKEVIKSVALNLESEWKGSEKITKINHIAIPNLQVKDMVTFGLVLCRESDILYHADSHSIARKIEVGHLLGRKIVQGWFFNMLHPASWLNEVIIPFLAINIMDKARPNDKIMDLYVVQTQREYLHLEADYSLWPLTQTSNSIENLFYNEVLALFRMLQHTLSEEIFWNSIRKYLDSKESSYEAFQETMIAEYKTKNEYEYGNLRFSSFLETMNVWATEKNCPVIDVDRNYSTFHRDEDKSHNYSIINIHSNFSGPVTFTVEKSYNFVNTLPNLWLIKESPTMVIIIAEEKGWIIFNIQQIGYYRVNYDLTNWVMISKYLDSENYTKIHVLNRAQIIDDAFHFMIARKLDSVIFWDLTTYLKREEDYVAWYPMFKALEYMSRVFPLKVQNVDDIKDNMRDILDKLLEKLKYDVDLPNEHDLRKCLREEALKWICLLGSITCHYKAERTLRQHLENPGAHKLLPWWKTWIYCNALKRGNNLYDVLTSSWKRMQEMGNCNDEVLQFVPCSQNSDNIKNYLHLIKDAQSTLCNNAKIQQNPQVERNLINNFLVTIAKHATNNDTLTYILENFGVIRLRQINSIAALIVSINNIYSMKQLDNLKEFITYIHNVLKTQRITYNILNNAFLTDRQRKKYTTPVQFEQIIREKIQIRKTEISNLLHIVTFFQLPPKVY